MTTSLRLSIRLSILAACAAGAVVSAADWPAWRGPVGSSSTTESALPVTWSATQNVAWKAPVAGLGVSSPIVSGGRVFVTSQIGTGTRRAGNHPRLVQGGDASAAGERALGASGSRDSGDGKIYFVVEAFDRATGQLWSDEHGPQGGDELNLIRRGGNYGWPLATFGTAYEGQSIAVNSRQPGTELPVHYWVPLSIAPSSLAVETQPVTTEIWVGALAGEMVVQLSLAGDCALSADRWRRRHALPRRTSP